MSKGVFLYPFLLIHDFALSIFFSPEFLLYSFPVIQVFSCIIHPHPIFEYFQTKFYPVSILPSQFLYFLPMFSSVSMPPSHFSVPIQDLGFLLYQFLCSKSRPKFSPVSSPFSFLCPQQDQSFLLYPPLLISLFLNKTKVFSSIQPLLISLLLTKPKFSPVYIPFSFLYS